MAAKGAGSTAAPAAMAALCSRYWPPLYSYIRRRGYSPEDAQDLTQAYFARLLEKKFLDDVDARYGKFRSFLLASLQHFLANEWDRAQAAKRGGGTQFLSLSDFAGAEEQYSRNSASAPLSPEQVYERSWGVLLLQHAMARLQSEFAEAGKSHLFDALKLYLTGDQDGVRYASIAEQLGMTEGAARVAVHRMRDRFRALLRTEIARSLSDPQDAGGVDEELRFLRSVL